MSSSGHQTVVPGQKLRILYLHQYFVPPQGHGGTRSYEFARRLIANGHDVCLITSSAMLPEPYRRLRRVCEVELAGIPLIVIPTPYSNEMSFARRTLAFFQFAILASYHAAFRHADVVFATSTPRTIAVPGVIARIWQRIPLVFEVRDLWPELPIAVGALRNPLARAAARALEWLAYRASTHVVALSPGMAEGVKRRGIPTERITVIPNSCDLELFDVPPECGTHIRQQLRLRPEQPLVIYSGTFGHINGVEYLVDLAAATKTLAPEIRFLLVGDGVERKNVTKRAEALGLLGQNLWIWAPLAKAQMPDLLAAATVATSLFIPLKPMWNNSANKFFDALAAGKPIAINYGGWQADLLNETGAGVVLSADDPSEAARQLAAFVQDKPRLQSAGEAARHLARSRFDRDQMAQELEAILRSVVEKQLDQ